MRAFQLPAVLLISWCAVSALWAGPENDRHGPPGRSIRVTFYEHSYYRGGSVTLEVGDGIENLARWKFSNGVNANDRISSIRIEGRAEVLLFRDAGFRGTPLVLTDDVSDLDRADRNSQGPTWNDVISSIRVEARDRRSDRGGPGRREEIDVRQIERMIRQAYRDILQRDVDSVGLALFRDGVIDRGWSEKEVRDRLRRSDEYREVVTRIVEKAYRELLGREVDAWGRKTYTDVILHKGWTEEDVRNELRKSDEYKRRRK